MVSIVDFQLTAPIMLLTFGALILLLNEVSFKSNFLRSLITIGSLVLSIAGLIKWNGLYTPDATAFSGFIYGDRFSWLSSLIVVSGALVAFLLGFSSLVQEKVSSISEYYSLFLMSIVGALVLITARELILLFIGLEIMSIALYTMCSFNLWSSRSSEAGLKYFLLGSMSSAIFLYGIALLYGLSASFMIPDVATWALTDGAQSGLLFWIAFGFLLVGFAFKIGLVPFHFWVPDVYDGAPTIVTAFMACVIKAAAVFVAMRGLWVMFGEPNLLLHWSQLLWVLAVLTMTFGNLIALRQRSVKRMLAYSSIAHAGYMTVAFLVPTQGGGAAIIFYVVAYMFMTFGAFGIVMAVSDSAPAGSEADSVDRFNGLGLKNPTLGILMTIFMFSLAGLPPGLAGFLGKFYIFNAALKGHYTGLVIIAVINSAISCYYYLRVLVAMYFSEEKEPGQVFVKRPVLAVICVCALVSVFLGMFPSRLHSLGVDAVSGLHAPVGLIVK